MGIRVNADDIIFLSPSRINGENFAKATKLKFSTNIRIATQTKFI